MRYLLLLFLFLFLFLPRSVFAQADPTQEFYKGSVVAVIKEGTRSVGGVKNQFQEIRVKILDGKDKGKEIVVENGGTFTLQQSQKVKKGETILLSAINTSGKITYSVADKFRLYPLLILIAGFLLFTFALTGKKGIGAILGLLVSLGVILWYIVPQIIAGSDPLLTSIIGSLIIMLVSIFLAHGVNKQTSVAVGATFLSLILTGIFAVLFVNLVRLTGLGSEDAYSLLFRFQEGFNLQGLLLGGIIIGALGVLDDTTTTQAATVFTLAEANPQQDMLTLIKRGFRVGKEHILSLINTLVLAYAGASIAIFIFLSINLERQAYPLWVMLNSEIIAEEVVRTIAGSMGLILAVPITTVLAAFFAKNTIKIK